MIDGVNDHDWQADRIAEKVRGMPAHVNLIPLNDVRESPLKPSRRIAAFQRRLAGLGERAEPFIRPLSTPGKYRVDLKGANARWLELAGVPAGQIALCSACTACDLENFWSHRVQGDARGSMAAMIQLV